MSRASDPNSSAADKTVVLDTVQRRGVSAFNQEISDLVGQVGSRGGPGRPELLPAAPSPATILPSCAPEEIGQLKERQALVLADNGKPIIAHLARCIDGKAGRRLKSGPGLEAVVTWLNHEYVWDAAGVTPPCWPQHCHLLHKIAVLAVL